MKLNLSLKYPPFDVRVKNTEGKSYIFDPLRKKWIMLTPEEWVRQHVVNYLCAVKKYPVSLIAIEKLIHLNGVKKRFDIVIFHRDKTPFLLVECKAPFIEINSDTLEQALRYNLVLKSSMLMLTNGLQEFVFDAKNNEAELPDYK